MNVRLNTSHAMRWPQCGFNQRVHFLLTSGGLFMPIANPVLLEPTPSSAGPVFSMTTGSARGVAVLAVAGDLDQLTTEHFDHALAALLYDPVQMVVVDLTDTTFLSTCAMTTLVSAHHRLQNASTTLVVVAHGPASAHPLRVLGLTRALTIVESLETALRRAPRGQSTAAGEAAAS